MFMFTHDCSACDRRQLIFPSMIEGVTRTEDGTRQRVGTTPVALSGRGLIGLCAPPDASNPNTIEFEL